MKKNVLYVILGILLIFVLWFIGTYNSLVSLQENVNGQWANVESSYQRRFDLIPNLVETVKGAANFEQETYLQVTEARTKWLAGSGSPVEERIELANNVQGALARLLVSVENYPDLKASANFRDLQAQIEGTENRINVERNRYNDAVKKYNKKIRFFPASLLANMFGFERSTLFEADSGTAKAPEVIFV